MYRSLPATFSLSPLKILSVLEFGIFLPVATFRGLTLPSFQVDSFALKVLHVTCRRLDLMQCVLDWASQPLWRAADKSCLMSDNPVTSERQEASLVTGNEQEASAYGSSTCCWGKYIVVFRSEVISGLDEINNWAFDWSDWWATLTWVGIRRRFLAPWESFFLPPWGSCQMWLALENVGAEGWMSMWSCGGIDRE